MDRNKAANRNSTEIRRSYSCDGSGAFSDDVAVLTCPMDWVKSLSFVVVLTRATDFFLCHVVRLSAIYIDPIGPSARAEVDAGWRVISSPANSAVKKFLEATKPLRPEASCRLL